jgi:hypothetical protein
MTHSMLSINNRILISVWTVRFCVRKTRDTLKKRNSSSIILRKLHHAATASVALTTPFVIYTNSITFHFILFPLFPLSWKSFSLSALFSICWRWCGGRKSVGNVCHIVLQMLFMCVTPPKK